MIKWVRATGRVPFCSDVLDYWVLSGLQEQGFFAAFTTRFGGVSTGPYSELNLGLGTGEPSKRVRQNRKRLLQTLPSGVPERIQILQQVHSSDVVVLDGVTGTQVQAGWWCGPEADGHTTVRDDICMGLLFADCLPIYIIDTRSGAIGLAHGGWRGLTGGIISSLLGCMKRHWRTRLRDCVVALGPSIERSAYQVDRPVLAAVKEWIPWWREVTYPSARGRALLDLDEAAAAQLRCLGVDGNSIYMHPHGTYYCDDFYSHRRDGSQTGRAMAIISRCH